jgi:hypothetical protein
MNKFSKKPQQEESQIVFKNTQHDANFNPYRKYYILMEVEGIEKVYDYVGKFRVEALAYFEEKARMEHGRITSTLHVYK